MLRVGDLLYGYCQGRFGDSYDNKRVEAIGTDWVVARECSSDGEDCPPLIYEGNPENLEQYKDKKWENL